MCQAARVQLGGRAAATRVLRRDDEQKKNRVVFYSVPRLSLPTPTNTTVPHQRQ